MSGIAPFPMVGMAEQGHMLDGPSPCVPVAACAGGHEVRSRTGFSLKASLVVEEAVVDPVFLACSVLHLRQRDGLSIPQFVEVVRACSGGTERWLG